MGREWLGWVGLLAWACVAPPPDELRADRVWVGKGGSSFIGGAVDAIDGPEDEPNLLVAAPFFTVIEQGRTGRGHAYRLAASTDSGRLTQVASTTYPGADDSCAEASFAGDLDADGDPDVLVWDNQVVDEQDSHSSEISLYEFGALERVDRSAAWGRLSTDSDVHMRGPNPCGDLDADGFRDLCFAVDYFGSDPQQVLFGPIGTGVTRLAGAAIARFHAPEGRAFGPVGGRDVDGDGADDAVVSVVEPYGFYLVSHVRRGDNDLAGYPYWRGATDPTVVDDLDGDALPDLFAFDRVFVDKDGGDYNDPWWVLKIDFDREVPREVVSGDLDGDGAADLAVALERDEDLPWRLLVFRGPLAQGTAQPEDADLVIVGRSADDGFGSSMVSADVDADGQDDLVVGAPTDRPVTGSVSLFLGSTLFP